MIHGFDDSTKEKIEVVAKDEVITLGETVTIPAGQYANKNFNKTALENAGIDTTDLSKYCVLGVIYKLSSDNNWITAPYIGEITSIDDNTFVICTPSVYILNESNNKMIRFVMYNHNDSSIIVQFKLRLLKVE